MAALPNVWHLRRVADASAKACWVCYKPSTSVLITPDKKDFFYICLGHLQDRKFCQPDADEAAAAAAKSKADLEREIEAVKKEYEERQKRKQEKRKEKEKAKEEDSKQDVEEEDKQDLKEKDDKIRQLSKSSDEKQVDQGPRIYSLTKDFYQMRLTRARNAEMAKRNRERLNNPAAFPSVPGRDP